MNWLRLSRPSCMSPVMTDLSQPGLPGSFFSLRGPASSRRLSEGRGLLAWWNYPG